MHWTIIASFIHDLNESGSQWLVPFVPKGKHEFTIVPRESPLANWHDRASPVSTRDDWIAYWKQTSEAHKVAKGGMITVFPQLAATAGMKQRLSNRNIPIVAWLFNVGECYSGLKGSIARYSLKNVDRFVVPTRRESHLYSKWLNVPLDRFEFVPIQKPEIPIEYEIDENDPFVLVQGSAHRDFYTFIEAIKRLGIRAIIVSGPRALHGIDIPPNIETPFGLDRDSCLRLAQQATINVVPMVYRDSITGAGHVTIVETMRLNRTLIASRCNGAEEYIIDGETGVLVEPYSVDDLTTQIDRLWNDPQLRDEMGFNAGRYAAQYFSDEAAGRSLGRILDSVASEYHL